MRRSLLFLIPLALAACISETHKVPVGLDLGRPTISRAVEAWEVVAEGRVEGTVVVYEVDGRGGERFFQVRNAHQQDLGMVDAEGRWWRYDPRSSEPHWLGTGTVREGVCTILGVDSEAPFFDVPIETLADEARTSDGPRSQN